MPNAYELKKKRDVGLCLECSNPTAPGKKKCQKCLDRVANYRESRLANGICSCGGTVVEGKRSCQQCLNKNAERARNRRQARRDNSKCRDCGSISHEPLCRKCLNKKNQQNIDYRNTLKHEVLLYYSIGNVPQCQCCRETNLMMLTIDHIEGKGNKHRQQVTNGRAAETFYRWLKKSGFPDGYRTYCFNCNVAAHLNGGVCPHQSS